MSFLRQLSAAQKWVIGLVGLTLALSFGNLGRAVVAVRYASNIPELARTTPLVYLAGMGGLWGAVFLACAVGLSGFRPWSRWLTLVSVTGYQIHVWVNQLLLDASDYARQTNPRDLFFTAILLLLFWGSLNVPAVRRAFRGKDQDRK